MLFVQVAHYLFPDDPHLSGCDSCSACTAEATVARFVLVKKCRSITKLPNIRMKQLDRSDLWW